MAAPLPTRFYDRDPVALARDLLGCEVWVRHSPSDVRRGRIVETEAYGGRDDLACHGHRGVTPRFRTLFGPPGRALVYLTYGVHHMLNAVARGQDEPYCVLIRALDLGPATPLGARGPGLLTRALGIDLRHDGAHLRTGEVRMLEGGLSPHERVGVSTRVGVEGAGPEWAARPWRFFIEGHPAVSPGRPSSPERAARVVAERARRRAARRGDGRAS